MDTDAELMRRALALAAHRSPPHAAEPLGRLRARPRRRGRRRGRDPAARRPARRGRGAPGGGDRARGATAYVTLEPCSHHGRTPPCTDALIDAGVARVVVAIEDPDPNVGGAGIAHLREHGITVDVGVEAEAATRLARPVPRASRARAFVRRAEDGDQPRRSDRRARRLVAVDHRARGTRRRARAPRRLAGGHRRRRDRARRPAEPHRARHA